MFINTTNLNAVEFELFKWLYLITSLQNSCTFTGRFAGAGGDQDATNSVSSSDLILSLPQSFNSSQGMKAEKP